MKPKVYLITNLPVAYRVDLFNLLQQELGKDITFCFISETGSEYKNRIAVFDNEPFIERSKFYNGSSIFSCLIFFVDLVRDQPDIIINSGMSLRTLFLLAYKFLGRKKIFIWWGGTFLAEQGISYLKLLYRRIIASSVDGALFYSKIAREYFNFLAKKKNSGVIIGNNTRNTLAIHKKILALRTKNKRTAIRILSVGFLSKEKNIVACLKALFHLKNISSSVELLIAGDGPEQKFLEIFCQKKGLMNVHFLGFVSPKNMLNIYANADIYIHPSKKDRWPQTYNEAAAAGLPILISETSGVYDEYIEKYEDIALFQPDDDYGLANRITLLINNQSLRKEMGAKALECALKHDAKYACRQIMNLVNV